MEEFLFLSLPHFTSRGLTTKCYLQRIVPASTRCVGNSVVQKLFGKCFRILHKLVLLIRCRAHDHRSKVFPSRRSRIQIPIVEYCKNVVSASIRVRGR